MKDLLRYSFPQMSLLQSLPTLELRSSCHDTENQSFALELMRYTNKVRFIALGFFLFGVLAIIGTISFEAWQAIKIHGADLSRDTIVTVLDHLHWNVMTGNKIR